MTNTFDKMITDAEKELRDLKTASRQAGSVRCYSWSIEEPPSQRLRVYYGDGDQPIISEFYSGMTIMPYRPDEQANTQFAKLSAQSVFPLTIVATRPILRVEFIGVLET